MKTIDTTQGNWTYITPLNPEDWPTNPHRLGDLPKPARSAAKSSPPPTQRDTVAKPVEPKPHPGGEATPTPALSALSARPN